MNTKIYENPALHSMRALVLATIDRIDFRHHGIGVLQGYVVEGCEPEIRVHIWSKRLLKPGMDVSGDVHDHRFDMVSHVLYGTVLHEELIPSANPDGDHTMMALTHARAAAETNYRGPTTPLGGRYSVERKLHKIHAGFSYSFPARRFHHSPHTGSGVAVTVVEKWQQREDPARLLYPVDYEPVMAFGHAPDKSLIQSVIETAKESLKR
jgi:hypothetical protein